MENQAEGKSISLVSVPPILSIINAVIKTMNNPNAENIINDLDLALTLIKKFKDELSSAHPNVIDILKVLFHGTNN